MSHVSILLGFLLFNPRYLGVEQEFGKIGVLFVIKVISAMYCALAQAIFIAAIARRFGRRVSNLLFVFLLFSSGFDHAGHAILPQSFTMNTLTLAWAAWVNASDPRAAPAYVRRHFALMIFWVALAGLLGWPFIVFMVLPMGWQALKTYRPWDWSDAPLPYWASLPQGAAAAIAAGVLPPAPAVTDAATGSQSSSGANGIASADGSANPSANGSANASAGNSANNSGLSTPRTSHAKSGAFASPNASAGDNNSVVTVGSVNGSASVLSYESSLNMSTLRQRHGPYSGNSSNSSSANSSANSSAASSVANSRRSSISQAEIIASNAAAAAASVNSSSVLAVRAALTLPPLSLGWLLRFFVNPIGLSASAAAPLALTSPYVSFEPARARQWSLLYLAAAAAASAAGILGLSVLVDWHYYNRAPVIAVWNIAMYNSNFAGDDNDDGAGQQLYGTEPWTYYFVNLFLNFGVAFGLAVAHFALALISGAGMVVFGALRGWPTYTRALLGFPAPGVSTPRSGLSTFSARAASYLADWSCSLIAQAWLLTPMYLWVLVMFPQPHKEERFLYVIYPLLCLAAAFGLEILLACVQVAADAASVAVGFNPSVLDTALVQSALNEPTSGSDNNSSNNSSAKTASGSDCDPKSANNSASDSAANASSVSSNANGRSRSSSLSHNSGGGNSSGVSASLSAARAAFVARPAWERIMLYFKIIVFRARDTASANNAGLSNNNNNNGSGSNNFSAGTAASPTSSSSSSATASTNASSASASAANAVCGPIASVRGSLATLRRRRRAPWRLASWIVAVTLFILHCTLSVSRAFAVLYNFSAPAVTFFTLYAQVSSATTPGLVAFAAFHTVQSTAATDSNQNANSSANSSNSSGNDDRNNNSHGDKASHAASASGARLGVASSGVVDSSDPTLAVAGALKTDTTLMGAITAANNYFNLTGRPPLGYARETMPRLVTMAEAKTPEPLVSVAGLSLADAKLLAEQSSVARVCVGKEWYRFPSYFYLPEAAWAPVTEAEVAKAQSERDSRDGLPTIITTHYESNSNNKASSSSRSSSSSSANGGDFGEDNVFALGSAVGRIFTNQPHSTKAGDSAAAADGYSKIAAGYSRLVRPRLDLYFIDCDFGGLLPQHFGSNITASSVRGATAPAAKHMNELNRREEDRFIPLSECDFVVDTDLGPDRTHPKDAWASRAASPAAAGSGSHASAVQTGLDKSGEWWAVTSAPLIDIDRSGSLHRAFYVHGLWQKRNRFVPMTLWRRVKKAGEGAAAAGATAATAAATSTGKNSGNA